MREVAAERWARRHDSILHDSIRHGAQPPDGFRVSAVGLFSLAVVLDTQRLYKAVFRAWVLHMTRCFQLAEEVLVLQPARRAS